MALVGGHRAVLLVCLQQLRVVLHELLRAMVVVVFMDGLVRGTEDMMKMLMDTKLNKNEKDHLNRAVPSCSTAGEPGRENEVYLKEVALEQK